jgi:arabinofuranan 3-O-arabinosyltransferase
MSERKCDISGWLVRRASWHLWVVLGAVLGATAARTARLTSDGGMDNAVVVRAARTWLSGGSPYDDPHFLYLPSAVLAAAPQVLLPQAALRVLVPLAVTGCLVLGWACALRLYDVPLCSRFAALGLAGLAAGFAPFAHLVLLANWTATAALALPLGLLLAGRGRWMAAGAVIGAAVALKPLLAPLALLFLFARRWRALAVLVLVPSVASVAAALLLLGDPPRVHDEAAALVHFLSLQREHQEAALDWIGDGHHTLLAGRLPSWPGCAFLLLILSPSDSAESFLARDAFWAAMLGRS